MAYRYLSKIVESWFFTMTNEMKLFKFKSQIFVIDNIDDMIAQLRT
jgi:hypothetical protein